MMQKRLYIWLALLCALALASCDYPEKPVYEDWRKVTDSCTPYMVDVPIFHSPMSDWRVRHPKFLEEGVYTLKRCMICHESNIACNRCHDYVGVKRILPNVFDPGYSPGFIRTWHSVAPKEY